MVSNEISLAVSFGALGVSIFNIWLTWFHRGRIRMTAPGMIAFGYDHREPGGRFDAKVMVRALVWCTSVLGRAIESMFLRLHYQGHERCFPIWGVATDRLERGGGLLVRNDGIVAWHHFNASPDDNVFHYGSGRYGVTIQARMSGKRSPATLWTGELIVPDELAPLATDGSQQVWFDRNPDSGRFCPRLESRGPARQ